MTIYARVNDSEKTELEALQRNFVWQALKESEVLIDYVWIEDMRFEDQHDECWERPWFVTIELTCRDMG